MITVWCWASVADPGLPLWADTELKALKSCWLGWSWTTQTRYRGTNKCFSFDMLVAFALCICTAKPCIWHTCCFHSYVGSFRWYINWCTMWIMAFLPASNTFTWGRGCKNGSPEEKIISLWENLPQVESLQPQQDCAVLLVMLEACLHGRQSACYTRK